MFRTHLRQSRIIALTENRGRGIITARSPALYLDHREEVIIDPETMVVNDGGVISAYNSAGYRDQGPVWAGATITEHVNMLGGGPNFGHWVFEALTRLAVFDLSGSVTRTCVVSAGTPQKFIDVLPMLGVDKSIVSGPARFKSAYLASPPFARAADHVLEVWPGAYHWLRQRFGRYATVGTRYLKVFAIRKGATHRRLTNQDEIAVALKARGFLIVDFSTRSIIEQASIAQQCDTLVMPQGAGAQIGWFCDGHVVELCNPKLDGIWAGRMGAAINGNPYTRLDGLIAPMQQLQTSDSDYCIDTESLLETVR